MKKLKLLCVSDLHLGEKYTFLDYRSKWNQNNREAFHRFREGAFTLADSVSDSESVIEVDELVLLGDIFELATATITTAADAGRVFFNWLFQWVHPGKIVFVPGNHDHVFWMWWNIPPKDPGAYWWHMNPHIAFSSLKTGYDSLSVKASPPSGPIATENLAHRRDLITFFFGDSTGTDRFHVGYPAYRGPLCGPFGSADKNFHSLFAHGHLNDPEFVDPWNAGLRAWLMYAATGNWPDAADGANLNALEESTWKYTSFYWYPPEIECTWGEALYLAYVNIEEPHNCEHPLTVPQKKDVEPVPNLKEDMGQLRYFSDFIVTSMEGNDPGASRAFIYGHTHDGGDHSFTDDKLHLYNTGGWLDVVKNDPPHTHLFAIDTEGVAKMIRVGF